MYLWYLVKESFKRAYLYSLAAAGTINLLFTPLVVSHPELEGVTRMTTFQLSLLVFGAIFFGIILGKFLELAFQNKESILKKDKQQDIGKVLKSAILNVNIDSADFANKNQRQVETFFEGVKLTYSEYRITLKEMDRLDKFDSKEIGRNKPKRKK